MKDSVKTALLPTLLHTLELAVIILAVIIAQRYIGLPLDGELTILVLAALTKFARTSTNDYVNK